MSRSKIKILEEEEQKNDPLCAFIVQQMQRTNYIKGLLFSGNTGAYAYAPRAKVGMVQWFTSWSVKNKNKNAVLVGILSDFIACSSQVCLLSVVL